MVISLKKINPLECQNVPLCQNQIRTNDAGLKYKLHHFRTTKKVKTDIFIIVIYKLIYLLSKLQERFPSCALVCLPDPLGKYFLYF